MLGVRDNAVIDIEFIEDSGVQSEPVTRSEALAHCRIDDLGQDTDIIDVFITTARQQCEDFTNIGFINRNIVAVLNNSLGNGYIPYGPNIEVSKVETIEGIELSLSNGEYEVTGTNFKALKTPVLDWVKLTYTAGYTSLPQVLKTALLQQVSYLYEHRGETDANQLSPIAKSLLKPHRRV